MEASEPTPRRTPQTPRSEHSAPAGTPSESAPLGTPGAPAAHDVVAVLEVCNARLLDREGIAMFVALDDARPGRQLNVDDDAARRDGTRVGNLFDHYYAGLQDAGFPGHDPGEPDRTGARELIDTLVVLSDQHLRAQVEHSLNDGGGE